VHLGAKKTAIWSGIWWAVSIALFAVVNWPVALANAIIAYLLVAPLLKDPTPERAHSLYKYSIAFPYVAGTVGGVQLVTALVFGLYP